MGDWTPEGLCTYVGGGRGPYDPIGDRRVGLGGCTTMTQQVWIYRSVVGRFIETWVEVLTL